MEIMTTQLSWIILALMLPAGSTGTADFSWSESGVNEPTVACSGRVSFDMKAGKEKLRLRKICQPGSRHPVVEDVLVRLDKHQVMELDALSMSYQLMDQPESFSESSKRFLAFDPALLNRSVPLARAQDERDGWWTRIQGAAGMPLPSALHYASLGHSLSLYFNGQLGNVDPAVFELPKDYKAIRE